MSHITDQAKQHYTTNLRFFVENTFCDFENFDYANLGISDVICILQSHKDLFSDEESYPYRDFMINLCWAILSEIKGSPWQTLSSFSELLNTNDSSSKVYLLRHRESIMNVLWVFTWVMAWDIHGKGKNPDIAKEIIDTRNRSSELEIELLILIDLQLWAILNLDMSKRISYKELREKYSQLPDPSWMNDNFWP